MVCSTAPRCFVTGFDPSSTVFTSADPAGGAGAWAVSPQTPPFPVGGVSDPTSLCVTVNNRGIATTTNPTGGAWTQRSISDGLSSVSCPSASLCVAVGTPGGTAIGQTGALDFSTDPTSGTWTHVGFSSLPPLLSISCPSTSLCVATDSRGDVMVSTNPTGDASAWTVTPVEPAPCVNALPCTVERVEVSDKTGLHTIDETESVGSNSLLTGLTLNGDTLSWSHDGSARTATLTPP